MKATTTKQHTKTLCYGEILWDILPSGSQPGGAPLNVAYHLNKLGVQAGLISRVGDDALGRQLRGLLDQWGIENNLVQTDKEYATSEVLVTLNSNKEPNYKILNPVAWDFIKFSDQMEAATRTASYLVYGSLSSRNQISRETLAAILENQAIKVLDINLREPYVDKQDLKHLLSKADIAKFNIIELKRISSLFGGFYIAEQDKVAFIQDTFQISELLVTKGRNGASNYSAAGVFHAIGPKITATDTVGSGDAFLAGFLAGRHYKRDAHIILNDAVAMGAFTATLDGGCPNYSLTDFEIFKANQIN